METFMEVLMFVIVIIIAIVMGVSNGIKTADIAAEKGYEETKWFWKGFFQGRWALLEAKTLDSKICTAEYTAQSSDVFKNGWKCKKCGTNNPSYTGTCSCGYSKHEQRKVQEEIVTRYQEAITKKEVAQEEEKIELIKKYKELLDSNAITIEEYEEKKKEIMNM